MILKHTKAYEYIEAVEKLHEMIEYSNYREHKIECSEKEIAHVDEVKRMYEEAILNDEKLNIPRVNYVVYHFLFVKFINFVYKKFMKEESI